MQRGLSLVELAQKIENNRSQKADHVVPAAAIKMQVREADKAPTLTIPLADAEPLNILPTAHSQIGTVTNIPAKYYDRMLTAAPQLLADNVNHWLSNNSSRRMVRTIGGSARAFLSDRYNRIENEEIAAAVLPVLLNIPGITVTASEITDQRMYLLATTDRVQGEVRVGDVVQAGVAISNSEVGLGAVQVRPLVYRLVCSNGLIVPDGKLTARHVGRRIDAAEDLNAIFSDETRKADDRALLLKVRDVVTHALDEAAFKQTVAKMSGLTSAKIEGDPANVVVTLAKKVGATEDERGGILRALIEGGDLSAFGLMNAVTFQAHAAKSFDRAVEFEQMGGDLLNLSRNEWSEILQAA